ncbi:hypothetical protein ACFSYD_01630 [Paracoccus aerius]
MTRTDRDALLDAALTHVPFEGMNDRALMAGARDLTMSPDLARVHFPQGGASLAAAYHRRADAMLRDSLAQTPPGPLPGPRGRGDLAPPDAGRCRTGARGRGHAVAAAERCPCGAAGLGNG